MVYYNCNDVEREKPMWACAFEGSAKKKKPLKNLKPVYGELRGWRFHIYDKNGEMKGKHYDFHYQNTGFAICDTEEEAEEEYNNFVKDLLFDIDELKKKYEKYIINTRR